VRFCVLELFMMEWCDSWREDKSVGNMLWV
jgi:hypothetical protein